MPPAGFGVVAGDGIAGPSLRVTGFLPGASPLDAGGGRDPGLDEGAEVRPVGGGLSEAGVEAALV
jgi:hypothetical protein